MYKKNFKRRLGTEFLSRNEMLCNSSDSVKDAVLMSAFMDTSQEKKIPLLALWHKIKRLNCAKVHKKSLINNRSAFFDQMRHKINLFRWFPAWLA